MGEVLTREPAVDQGPGERRYLYELSTDDIVDPDLNSSLRVGDGPAPDEDFLLLYGTEPDGPEAIVPTTLTSATSSPSVGRGPMRSVWSGARL